MDRIPKALLTACGLVFLVWAGAYARPLKSQNVGTVTQSFNTVTYLNYSSQVGANSVAQGNSLKTDGSYLTGDDSYLTAKLFEGSWLRASPKTKFALDFDPHTKVMTINLFLGSLKILLSQNLNKGSIQKIIIKSADILAEASEAKFSVVRTPVLGKFGLYVEKGVVTMIKDESLVHVHALEMASVQDEEKQIPRPRKMTDKQLEFLKGKVYLKGIEKKNSE